MISHWQLDLDAMDGQSAFDGIAVGNPVWYTKKDNPESVKIGSGSVGLNGQSCIEIDASQFPHFYESCTLEAWFKTTVVQQTQVIISKGSDSWQMGVEAATGRLFLSCAGLSGADYLTGSTFVADGLWHHAAGVYDFTHGTLSLYLDGAVDVEVYASGQINSNHSVICIGGNPQLTGQGWYGILDNVCLYNYALTLQQVFNRNTYHVNVDTGIDDPMPFDPEWGKGRLKPFKTIQHAIDVAANGDIVMVWPGIYQESLFFMGKAITVRSAADAAILEPNPDDGVAVTFIYGEQADSILEHFVILHSDIALYVHQSSPTLRYLTVVNNDYGLDCIFNSRPDVEHCIFWNNASGDIVYDTYVPHIAYSCIQRPFSGEGNFSADPLFVNPDSSVSDTMDFHLQSEYGRYLSDDNSLQRPLPESWVTDICTSPCIDAGRADVNPFCETLCNGGRINIGAYGNTPFASKSPWFLPADLDFNGRVFLEDILLFSEQWLMPGVQ